MKITAKKSSTIEQRFFVFFFSFLSFLLFFGKTIAQRFDIYTNNN